MNLLSHEAETILVTRTLQSIDKYLEAREKVPKKLTGLITSKELEDELDIKYKTLQRWEKAGLPRYLPPIEDTRKNYYLISDVLIFLGVDDDR